MYFNEANQRHQTQENLQDSYSKNPSPCTSVFEYPKPTLGEIKITVDQKTVESLFYHAALLHQQFAQTQGFLHGQIPLEYIMQHYKEHITNHIQEFLLKFYVINYLYDEIRNKELVVVGDPQLTAITHDQKKIVYNFELTLFPDLQIFEWKHFPFKTPKRKNYKDLDHQAFSFLKDEREFSLENNFNEIQIGDWVFFSLLLLEENQQPLAAHTKQNFWFKIGNEETESLLRSIFIGRKLGDKFYTNNKGLQNYFSDQLDTNYLFELEILDIVPYKFFCIEQFKHHFKLKTQKEVHQKLIEIFSYRNDISQRREIVEESFKLMLTKHKFTLPATFIAHQEELIVEKIQGNPDYNVYRMQKDFNLRIRQLAEKQMKELIFIDKFSYQENIFATEADIKGYLNLMNRPRTKEFICFEFSSFKIQGQEVPIPLAALKKTCLREKAINHIIYHLTKK